jgi:phosphatidylserine/phosphatidylglycerophosphate/cardiolipin synthase-like enzyme
MLTPVRLLALVALIQAGAPAFEFSALAKPPGWNVYFSPNGGCAEAVADTLGKAKDTILVQAYSFTSAPIAEALVAAHRRGVKVQVILDKSQRTEKYSSATFLKNNGIPCLIDDAHAIAHNKVMVIDEKMVITGSFNFTKNAEEQNAENLLIVEDASLAAQYLRNWKAHQAHSDPYAGPTAKKSRAKAPAKPERKRFLFF